MHATSAPEESSPADKTIELLRSLINEFTAEPSKIRIRKEPFGYATTLIEIQADASDFGNILGSNKAHLAGLQTVCKILSEQSREDLQLELTEIPGGERKRAEPFESSGEWPARARVEAMFQKVFDALFENECKVQITTGPTGRTGVDVLVSQKASPLTVEWLNKKLTPLVVAICARHKRRPAWLKIIRDQMLYEQATFGKEPTPPGWDPKKW